MSQLSFKNQKITVDWIGFKFQNLDRFGQTKLAKYLFKIGFNSYQESGKLAKQIKILVKGIIKTLTSQSELLPVN